MFYLNIWQKDKLHGILHQDKQVLFNAVYHGLRDQNWRKSLSDLGRCRLRGENGCKCAIGHIIPDDLYCHTMELHVSESGDYLHVGVTEDRLEFLTKLRKAHDSATTAKSMCENMQAVAGEYGLTVPSS